MVRDAITSQCGGRGVYNESIHWRNNRMNKSDLVDALANQAGMTKADAARALEALFGSGGIIASALESWNTGSDHWFWGVCGKI